MIIIPTWHFQHAVMTTSDITHVIAHAVDSPCTWGDVDMSDPRRCSTAGFAVNGEVRKEYWNGLRSRSRPRGGEHPSALSTKLGKGQLWPCHLMAPSHGHGSSEFGVLINSHMTGCNRCGSESWAGSVTHEERSAGDRDKNCVSAREYAREYLQERVLWYMYDYDAKTE